MFNILMLIEKGVYYLVALFFTYPLMMVILQMFQQNRYENHRYFKWQTNNLENLFKNILIPIIVAIILVLLNRFISLYWLEQLLSIFTFIIFGYLWLILLGKKEQIKPLVFTNRVKRQMVTFFVVDLFVICLIRNYSITIHFLIAFIPFVNYWLIYLVSFINMPIEKYIQNQFIKDAKGIVMSNSNLKKIGITGSYGKTSTKNIVGEILAQKYYTLITPASFNTPMGITRTIREYLKPIHQVFVCEMGADKVGDISYLMDFVKPEIGIVTSIGQAHLATFKSQNNIINEKMQMIENLPVNGVGVLNYDNQFIAEYRIKNSCKILTYGISNTDVDYYACDIKYSPEGTSFKVVDRNGKKHKFTTKLLGEHNVANILSGICVGQALGIEFKDLITAVAQVKQIPHRLEVKKYLQHTMIDDGFNSNPVGSAMALEVLKMMPKPRVLVTCGMIDLGEAQYRLNKEFGLKINGCADKVILVGPLQSAPIKDGLIESGYSSKDIIVVNSTKEAFNTLNSMSKKPITFLVENDLPDAFNR